MQFRCAYVLLSWGTGLRWAPGDGSVAFRLELVGKGCTHKRTRRWLTLCP